MPRTCRAASQRVKPSSTWGRLFTHRRHDRRALAPAAQRLRHRLDRLRHPQPVAAELVAQLVEPHRGDLTDWRTGPSPWLLSEGIGERERGARSDGSRNPPAPSSFWGQ